MCRGRGLPPAHTAPTRQATNHIDRPTVPGSRRTDGSVTTSASRSLAPPPLVEPQHDQGGAEGRVDGGVPRGAVALWGRGDRGGRAGRRGLGRPRAGAADGVVRRPCPAAAPSRTGRDPAPRGTAGGVQAGGPGPAGRTRGWQAVDRRQGGGGPWGQRAGARRGRGHPHRGARGPHARHGGRRRTAGLHHTRAPRARGRRQRFQPPLQPGRPPGRTGGGGGLPGGDQASQRHTPVVPRAGRPAGGGRVAGGLGGRPADARPGGRVPGHRPTHRLLQLHRLGRGRLGPATQGGRRGAVRDGARRGRTADRRRGRRPRGAGAEDRQGRLLPRRPGVRLGPAGLRAAVRGRGAGGAGSCRGRGARDR